MLILGKAFAADKLKCGHIQRPTPNFAPPPPPIRQRVQQVPKTHVHCKSQC